MDSLNAQRHNQSQHFNSLGHLPAGTPGFLGRLLNAAGQGTESGSEGGFYVKNCSLDPRPVITYSQQEAPAIPLAGCVGVVA